MAHKKNDEKMKIYPRGDVFVGNKCIGYFPSIYEGGKATRITVANRKRNPQPANRPA